MGGWKGEAACLDFIQFLETSTHKTGIFAIWEARSLYGDYWKSYKAVPLCGSKCRVGLYVHLSGLQQDMETCPDPLPRGHNVIIFEASIFLGFCS